MSVFTAILILFCMAAGSFAIGAVSGSKLGSYYNNNITLKTSMVFVVCDLIALTAAFVIGRVLWVWVESVGPWLAFSMVFLLGVKLMLESIEKSPSLNYTDIVKGNYLVQVAVQAAADSFMFGFALSMFFGHRVEIFLLALLCSAVFNFFAMLLGLAHGHTYPRTVFGKRLEMAAGIIIAIVAVSMLFTING